MTQFKMAIDKKKIYIYIYFLLYYFVPEIHFSNSPFILPSTLLEQWVYSVFLTFLTLKCDFLDILFLASWFNF